MNRMPCTNSCLAAAWVLAVLLGACHWPEPSKAAEPREIHTADYDLIIPAEQKALLILFPCFSCDAADTRSESKITNEALANGIAVLLMHFNRHIFMTYAEREAVISTIEQAVKANELNAQNTFIGGFSSGGNVSVLLAKDLLNSPRPDVGLKGLFAVDSPLDLSHLYGSSKRRVERPSFPEYKDEGRMIVALLDSILRDPTTNPTGYEVVSPLMNTEASVSPLKDLPVRFYTEPDTTWWRVNRGDRYEDLNAYALGRIHGALKAAGNTRAEFITTKDRGIQHGNRHPHAWSIVDEKELVNWIQVLSN
ncbi:MAG: hypothetical protein ABI432_02425 [Flavobacteriales bacterium]